MGPIQQAVQFLVEGGLSLVWLVQLFVVAEPLLAGLALSALVGMWKLFEVS
jgi:hypothetical protein